MQTNAIPATDANDNPTGCCPRFHPERRDGVTLHFDHKPFVKASTVSFFHMPLNMGHVMAKTWAAIEKAHAASGAFLVLSHDTSAWQLLKRPLWAFSATARVFLGLVSDEARSEPSRC